MNVHGGGGSLSLQVFEKKKQLLALAFSFPSHGQRTRWIQRLLKPNAPGYKEAPSAQDALCPCLWVSLGWVSFAREQAEEVGRFWFLWILG